MPVLERSAQLNVLPAVLSPMTHPRTSIVSSLSLKGSTSKTVLAIADSASPEVLERVLAMFGARVEHMTAEQLPYDLRQRGGALALAGCRAQAARMGRFRLLALDIDGTVTDSTDTLRPRVREAIRAVAARGVRVVLVTGRSPFTTRWVVDELGIPVGAVMGNGAVTADDFGQPAIERRLVPLGVAAETIAAWRERQLVPLVFDDPARSGDVSTDALERLPAAFVNRNQRRIRQVPDLLASLDCEPLVVSTMGDEASIRAEALRLAEQLIDRASVQPVYHPLYATWTLDVGAHGVDKWSSLRSLAARAGIGPDAILAIGDGLNDIPMLRGAGWSIAMGNAAPDTRAVADEVAPSCDDEGLVWALERHFPRVAGG